MLSRDEDALFCDLWETYGVTDWRALPVLTTARLFCGLGEGSRCGRILSGAKTDNMTLLLASAVDRLSWLCWAQTEDGRRGRNRPESLADRLTEREPDRNCRSFESAEAFAEAWRRIQVGER